MELKPTPDMVFLVSMDGKHVYRNGKEKTQHKNNNGYLFINTVINGKQKNVLVHRLVAMAWIDNPDNLPIVNHKDLNKLNNNVDNLEWITYQGNTSHWMQATYEATGVWNSASEKRKENYKNGLYGKQFHCRIPVDEAEILDKMLVRKNITFAEFVRMAIKENDGFPQ